MKLSRREFLKLAGPLAIGGCAAAYGSARYLRYNKAEALTVEHVQIPIKNLKSGVEGLKIVQLSDIHLHPHTKIEFVQKAIALANSLQPDLVVLTGDYVSRKADSIFELAPVLAGLNAKYGVFTILGNHDLWTNRAVVTDALRAAGLPVLHNEGLEINVGQDSIFLAGLDDLWSGQPDLHAALDKKAGDMPVIMLAHEPDFADTLSADGQIALQISGHSHGGQVRLPGIGAPILPYLGKKYDQGLYKVNDMWLYTNRGIGLSSIPIRINCPPEITEFTLVGA